MSRQARRVGVAPAPMPTGPSRRWLYMVLAPALVAAALLLLVWRVLPAYTALAWVEIDGVFVEVPEAVIIEQLAPHTGQAVLGLDLRQLERQLASLPWVYEVRLTRLWPNGLRVQVHEQHAVARWGEAGLVNARGEVFEAGDQDVRVGLPLLNGPPERAAEVLSIWRRMQARLAGYELTPQQVIVDRRGSWRTVLDNGLELRLGPGDPLKQLARFVRDGLPVLDSRMRQLAYVDMRYTNGFAVARRDDSHSDSAVEGG